MEQKETRKKMHLSLALMVVMVSWLCPDLQAHQIINIKYIYHMSCVTHTLMKSLKKFILKMAMPTQDGWK